MNKYIENAYLKINKQTTTIKHNHQTKTKLSPQSPQWSRHSVARVRRRGDRPPPTLHEGVVCCLFGMENMVRQGVLCL